MSEEVWQISNGATVTGSLLAPDGSRLSVLTVSTLAWTIQAGLARDCRSEQARSQPVTDGQSIEI